MALQPRDPHANLGGEFSAPNRAPAAKVLQKGLANTRVANNLIAALGGSSTTAIIATSASPTFDFAGLNVGDLVIQFPAPAPAPAPGAPNLATAANFAVLASSTITNTGSSVITGNLGLYPGTSVTGFPPGTVNGTEDVANSVAMNAGIDATAAYNAIVAMAPGTTESALGGLTLAPGTYSSGSSMDLTGTLTLDAGGNPNAVWIFQMGSTLTTAASSVVSVINGGSAANVFWQVGSSATLGATSTFAGTILAQASITVGGGAGMAISGRLLALTGAVTFSAASAVADFGNSSGIVSVYSVNAAGNLGVSAVVGDLYLQLTPVNLDWNIGPIKETDRKGT